MMLTADLIERAFSAGRAYDDYVATGNDGQRDAWRGIYEQATLTEAQRGLVAGFEREIKVLVSSGVWCGDCVQQCPLIARIAEANSAKIALRFVDRDEHPEIAQEVKICGGTRVPVAIFAAEDFEPVSIFGDRTLARYRALAARQLGASCPVPGAPIGDDELRATMQDWVDEFERVHLVVRLSTRLRQKHGD